MLVQAQPLVISNPKLYAETAGSQESRLFPYYAGFSSAFTEQLLASMALPDRAVVFDPWNGSGTTTTTSYRNGLTPIGTDLNPAMVVVAKAALLSTQDIPSLEPLANTLIERARHRQDVLCEDDPLKVWFVPSSVLSIRRVEAELNASLISHTGYVSLANAEGLAATSALAAFFYVALFRAVRQLLVEFIPSNPTWTKTPETLNHRKRPTVEQIHAAFLSAVAALSARIRDTQTLFNREGGDVSILLGNAENLPLDTNSVDAIISSPPYCTRIDYAVATRIELSVLRVGDRDFDKLRRALTGTSTVPKQVDGVSAEWGKTCVNFLDAVYNHPSKASKTYYFKSHVAYFRSLYESVRGLSRVLRPGGHCVLVVQDSFYKDIHNDVPTMLVEMAQKHGFALTEQFDFSASRSMVGMNGRAKKYLPRRTNTESVLCFRLG